VAASIRSSFSIRGKRPNHERSRKKRTWAAQRRQIVDWLGHCHCNSCISWHLLTLKYYYYLLILDHAWCYMVLYGAVAKQLFTHHVMIS
jgi:hypothetical protein